MGDPHVPEETAGILSETEIKENLVGKGCTFLPERTAPVPLLDNQKINRLFGVRAEVVKTQFLPNLVGYLSGQIIIAPCERESEIDEWEKTLPPQILDYYTSLNCLRGNRLTTVLTTIPSLCLCSDSDLLDGVGDRARELISQYRGEGETKPYANKSIEQKVELALEVEKLAFDTLKLLSNTP